MLRWLSAKNAIRRAFTKKRALAWLKGFTGIDAPYEPPEDPEIVVNTHEQSPQESVGQILDKLLPRLRLK
jgi:adenylylsulfate kinase-like enzyme